MPLLRDILYLMIVLLTSPLWIWRLFRTGKWRTDWAGKFGKTSVGDHASLISLPSVEAVGGISKTILIHAVSVGEVNATRELVKRFENEYGSVVRIVISVTTDTGFARAESLYGERHQVVRYPFDFSWMVRRFFNAIKPDVVLLVELEVWPNFVSECARRAIDVAVINGRLSERSYSRYKIIRPLIRSAFAHLAAVGVQDGDYRERFIGMGAVEDRVSVTGTMKWDTAVITDEAPGASELAAIMGIDLQKPLVVCGSTGLGEEDLMIQQLAGLGDDIQVLCAPRKPERFEEAAEAMSKVPGGLIRRSTCETIANKNSRVFLLDTIGDLGKAYSLADVAVVGRSFCPLYGSDMIEPIALGTPTVIGPNTSDFADTMRCFIAGDGIIQLENGDQLGATVGGLLNDSDQGHLLAKRGRAVIQDQQGATAIYLQMAMALLSDESESKV